MKAFITGSRAYGYPREDSDIDFIVVCSKQDYQELWDMSDSKDTPKKLTFGKLNVICFYIDEYGECDLYDKWRVVHKGLVKNKPVTRDEAVAKFQAAGFGIEYTEKAL